jgi:uncharacterized membrane protein (Fun14 family)
MLTVSGVLVLVGLAFRGYGYLRAPAKQPVTEKRSPGSRLTGTGFLPSGPSSPEPTGEASPRPTDWSLENWSPAVSRLGLGFFAGFCVAYALRAFFKICIVAIGLIVLAVVGLQYAGVVVVDWTAAQTHYGAVTQWLAGQTATFRQFITGYLPSSGTAALGLFAGFRRS